MGCELKCDNSCNRSKRLSLRCCKVDVNVQKSGYAELFFSIVHSFHTAHFLAT